MSYFRKQIGGTYSADHSWNKEWVLVYSLKGRWKASIYLQEIAQVVTPVMGSSLPLHSQDFLMCPSGAHLLSMLATLDAFLRHSTLPMIYSGSQLPNTVLDFPLQPGITLGCYSFLLLGTQVLNWFWTQISVGGPAYINIFSFERFLFRLKPVPQMAFLLDQPFINGLQSFQFPPKCVSHSNDLQNNP